LDTTNKNEIDSCIKSIIQKPLFNNQIDNQNENIIKLAYSLWPFLRGYPDVLEELDVHIGGLITRNPKQFLNILNEYYYKNENHNFIGIEGLVGNFGDSYVDNFKAQNKLIIKRIKAIKSVKEPRLNQIQSEVLNQLDKIRKESF
jgi:hypothetical protein